ncbi:MAG: deoxyribodipyrimidine photo-lyase [Candidatus Zixiibacteriota bacterium]
MKTDDATTRKLNYIPYQKGSVVYWMQRDQRAEDNHALLHAQQLALEHKQPLLAVFCLASSFLGATLRQYGFMLRSLEETAKNLAAKNIPFVVLPGPADRILPPFVDKHGIGAVVTDFSPLRIGRSWRDTVAKKCKVPVYECDTHNIVPVRETSPKLEYAARTIRPKIHKMLDKYLVACPKLKKHPHTLTKAMPANDWAKLRQSLKVDKSVTESTLVIPGEKAAVKHLQEFIKHKLSGYAAKRNDPNRNAQSGLSPYFHFGQLAPLRAALAVKQADAPARDKEAFLEELIVRRELAENFCYYQKKYDSVAGFHDWARRTLQDHARDKREYLYTLAQFEQAETHDRLWNAVQKEMTVTGTMPGYLRMYWAKKVLEWTASPEEAMEIAVYLNDRYLLDGRDPNGYAGIAWSLGGVHDRPWLEREIFGKIRYMNYNGCKKKFDIEAYIARVEKQM